MSDGISCVQTDIAIIGGGLAGLSLAERLHRAGRDVRLFEARDRLGGRIDALRTPTGAVDLGPSWFWPGQPRMAALVADLGLTPFEQYAQGAVSFEDEGGTVHRGMGVASMAGSLRVAGGMIRLVEGLAARLSPERLHTGARVTGIARNDGRVTFADGQTLEAGHVVLALPPRLAARLTFSPELAPERLRALGEIPTWMGAHAKFVAVYDTPFWRAAGLSGDAMSRHGPLMEIHDASGPEGTPAALFGFVGVPAVHRAGKGAEIGQAALSQLARLFGPQALTPRQTALRDWAFEPDTAVADDHVPPRAHPDYGLPADLRDPWDGRLHFAVSEMAPEVGGFMEGALAAAEAAAQRLLRP